MKHAHIGLVALATILIAGCGGGSNSKTNGEEGADNPKPFTVVLPLGHGLSAAGEIEIEAGEFEETSTGARFSCPASAGDDGCVVTVKVDDPVRGTYTATSTGGQVRVTLPKDPEVERLERERDTAVNERDQQRRRADSLEGERDTARTERDTARTERDEEKERADKAEDEAEGTGNQLRQNNARRVLAGLNPGGAPTAAGTSVAVTPRYQASALVTPTPLLSTPITATGRKGKWFRTSIEDRDFATIDRIDVYSDVEAPKQIPFRDSLYNNGTSGDGIANTDDTLIVVAPYNPSASDPTEIIDSLGEVVGAIRIPDNARVSGVVASSFPKSGNAVKSFTVTDRGRYTQDQRRRSLPSYTGDDPVDADVTFVNDDGTPYKGRFRDEKRYPLRYTYEATGSSLAGARGTFTCASDTQPAANGCRVTNQNTHFSFFGPWVFTPDKSARVRVDDTEYMYFGWWARQTNPNDTAGTWAFRTFHGPTAARSSSTDIARLSGTATYVGTAAGFYSFFQPLDTSSDYGEFTAKATLRANFTRTNTAGETVSGTLDGFTTRNGNREGRPDWTVTLKQTAISGATVTAARVPDGVGPVSWKIKDEAVSAPDAGTWEAAFYSNLPNPQRGTTVDEEDATPTGIAGTFEAEYHDVGKMVGAFGAHKQ